MAYYKTYCLLKKRSLNKAIKRRNDVSSLHFILKCVVTYHVVYHNGDVLLQPLGLLTPTAAFYYSLQEQTSQNWISESFISPSHKQNYN